MDEQEKRETRERYDQRLKEFGHDPRALGWHKRQHLLRYEVLLSHWHLDGADLLDFGCGFGDMHAYCQSSGRAGVRYHGLDLNPSLIEEGRRRHPGVDLFARDALTEGLPETYDVILASGIYNFRLKDNSGFVEKTFALFAAHCRQGFAVNFLSNRVDYTEDSLYYADPTKVLGLCYKYSRRVLLRQDYMPFEFTVFVDLRNSFDKRFTVFPDYLRFIPDAEESQ